MGRSAQRIVLMSLIAVGTLVALYPRVPAPAPLFSVAGRTQGSVPLQPQAGPHMPTFAPAPGRTERMPVVPPVRPTEPGDRTPGRALHPGDLYVR